MEQGNGNFRVRSAKPSDLPDLMRMRARAIDQIKFKAYQHKHIVMWRDADVITRYRELAKQQCLWVIGPIGKPLASAGLRLANMELVAVFVEPDTGGRGYARRLVSKVEQAAAGYGSPRLLAEASLNAVGLYQRLGYQAGRTLDKCHRLGLPCLEMHKNLQRRRTRYQQQVLNALTHLGIAQTYGLEHKLCIQPPPKRLANAGRDCFQRPQRMTPASLRAWSKMQAAAKTVGIGLLLVSAYRDLAYQTKIVRRKLAQGQRLKNILKVTAAPGFSEHHSGRALDINTPGCPPLEAEFANTAAYHWLSQNAGTYGFTESYPENNIHEIAWEPWHWCYGDLARR